MQRHLDEASSIIYKVQYCLLDAAIVLNLKCPLASYLG